MTWGSLQSFAIRTGATPLRGRRAVSALLGPPPQTPPRRVGRRSSSKSNCRPSARLASRSGRSLQQRCERLQHGSRFRKDQARFTSRTLRKERQTLCSSRGKRRLAEEANKELGSEGMVSEAHSVVYRCTKNEADSLLKSVSQMSRSLLPFVSS